MNRDNEIVRKSNVLQYWRVVRRWACKNNDLTQADIELLIYLDPIHYFTIKDFRDGTLVVSWDKKRFWRLSREGWIERIKKGGPGDHSKYVVSQKGKRLINRCYRILLGEEEIPETARANTIMSKVSYSDKLYSMAINKFNNRER